jgi:isopenicillin-N epimerase
VSAILTERFAGVRTQWRLDPRVTQLNHGGFGAAPVPVLAAQQRLRDDMERNPTDFLTRVGPTLLGAARERLAAFLGADPAGMVFVTNATTAVQTALTALRLDRDDEVLTTDHCYHGVQVQLAALAARTGARVSVAAVPTPDPTQDAIVDAVVAGIGPRTRVLVVDHITSPTGIVLPVRRLADACRERGIVTVVDGAHATAMLPVDIASLGVDFWAGNLHKWLCAPKTAAVLWAAPEHRSALRPLVPSHFYEDGLHAAFDWTGTVDPSPALASVTALDFFTGLGWDDVRRHNVELAGAGARLVADALGTDVPVPDESASAMRIVRLPRPLDPDAARAVERTLLAEYGVEVPLTATDATRWVRLSAQVYNVIDDYARLADALPRVLPAS